MVNISGLQSLALQKRVGREAGPLSLCLGLPQSLAMQFGVWWGTRPTFSSRSCTVRGSFSGIFRTENPTRCPGPRTTYTILQLEALSPTVQTIKSLTMFKCAETCNTCWLSKKGCGGQGSVCGAHQNRSPMSGSTFCVVQPIPSSPLAWGSELIVPCSSSRTMLCRPREVGLLGTVLSFSPFAISMEFV